MNKRLLLQRCIFCFFLFFLCHCKEKETRKVQRSFYYWKTAFRLAPKEKAVLQQLSINQLYVKFFDVEWNPERALPQPAAKSLFPEAPPAGIVITPVVFITQEPLQRSSTRQLDTLAVNIGKLLSSLAATNKLSLSGEVQIDCDWTTQTKDKYFHLLNSLKQQPFFQGKSVSATIRLHQVKFISQNGVPPVAKGLLMCYNMGNLRNPAAKNSIIEEEELKKYIGNLDSYPLPLDVALPIFDWYILFEGAQYKGLVRDFAPGGEMAAKERIHFDADTTINGYTFRKGQWLRHERSEATVVRKCAERIGSTLQGRERSVILYHLDQHNIANYTLHELESFYHSLR